MMRREGQPDVLVTSCWLVQNMCFLHICLQRFNITKPIRVITIACFTELFATTQVNNNNNNTMQGILFMIIGSRQRKERLYHIDDTPSGVAEVIQDLDRSYEVSATATFVLTLLNPQNFYKFIFHAPAMQLV